MNLAELPGDGGRTGIRTRTGLLLASLAVMSDTITAFFHVFETTRQSQVLVIRYLAPGLTHNYSAVGFQQGCVYPGCT